MRGSVRAAGVVAMVGVVLGVGGCATPSDPKDRSWTDTRTYKVPEEVGEFETTLTLRGDLRREVHVDSRVAVEGAKVTVHRYLKRENRRSERNFMDCLESRYSMKGERPYQEKAPATFTLRNIETNKVVLKKEAPYTVSVGNGIAFVWLREGPIDEVPSLAEVMGVDEVHPVVAGLLRVRAFEGHPVWEWAPRRGELVPMETWGHYTSRGKKLSNRRFSWCRSEPAEVDVPAPDIYDRERLAPRRVSAMPEDYFHLVTAKITPKGKPAEHWYADRYREVTFRVRDSLSRQGVRGARVHLSGVEEAIVTEEEILAPLGLESVPWPLDSGVRKLVEQTVSGFPATQSHFDRSRDGHFTLRVHPGAFTVGIETIHSRYVGLVEEVRVPANASRVDIFIDRIGQVQRDAGSLSGGSVTVR